MAYHLVPDILGATILAATFVLCLLSFRREDRVRARPSGNAVAPQPSRHALTEQKSLGEILGLMNDSIDRTYERRSTGAQVRASRSAVVEPPDGIEVTVRVSTQHAPLAAPAGAAEVVNAVWEPVERRDLTFGRNFPTLSGRISRQYGVARRTPAS